jgi:hypothetical protein
MSDAWNHFYLVVSLFIAWTIALAYMGGKKVFWDYEAHPEDGKPCQ